MSFSRKSIFGVDEQRSESRYFTWRTFFEEKHGGREKEKGITLKRESQLLQRLREPQYRSSEERCWQPMMLSHHMASTIWAQAAHQLGQHTHILPLFKLVFIGCYPSCLIWDSQLRQESLAKSVAEMIELGWSALRLLFLKIVHAEFSLGEQVQPSLVGTSSR